MILWCCCAQRRGAAREDDEDVEISELTQDEDDSADEETS